MSLSEEEIRTETEGQPSKDTAKIWLSTSQGDKPQKKPDMLMP